MRLYEQMLLIRRTEERLRDENKAGNLPGAVHLYIGEEAIATGVCANLRDTDMITSTHRGHGHYLAKGGDLNAMLAEIWAKSTGICKGMGGSMHVADFSKGILGANGIVGRGFCDRDRRRVLRDARAAKVASWSTSSATAPPTRAR